MTGSKDLSRVHPIVPVQINVAPAPTSSGSSGSRSGDVGPGLPIRHENSRHSVPEPGQFRIHPVAPEDEVMFDEAAAASGWCNNLKNQDRLMYVMTDMVHPMVVHCMVGLEKPMTMATLEDMGTHLKNEYDAFSSVIKDGQWAKAEIVMSNHLKISELPADVDIQEFVSQVVSSRIPMDVPLWQLHLVSQSSTDQHMLVVRIHHCVGDGIALMTVLDKLLKRDEPSSALNARQRRKIPCYIKAIQSFLVILLAPLVFFQLLLMRADPVTCFRAKNKSAMKTVVWFNPMSLSEVTVVAKKVKGTINDVLASVAAGAIARYIEVVEGKRFHKDIKCICPYSVRSWPERFDLNNRVGAIFVSLPTHCDEPLKRLKLTKKRMDQLKNSAWVPVTLMLIKVSTRAMSTRICSWLQHYYASKCTLIFSNVRAAKSESELLGMKVKSVMGFVPLAGHLNLGFTTVSYNEQIFSGICANPTALTQPKLLTEMFLLEFKELKASLGIDDADLESGASPLRSTESGAFARDPMEIVCPDTTTVEECA